MKWLHFILSHSIFVALCATALCYQTVLLLQLEAEIFLYSFIFFATLCSYNLYWLLSKKMFGTVFYNAIFFKKEAGKIILFGVACTGMLVSYMQAQLCWPYVWPAIALTALYTLPLLPFKFLRFTRRLGVVKTCLLALTWTYVTAYLPIQRSFAELDAASVFIISRRFLFMLMLCIIFDSRDSAMDKIRGLHSLATDLGPRTLRIVIISIFLILFCTNFLSRSYGITLAQSISLQVSTIALLVVYYYSTRKQGYFFYYFCVDGLMLFSALATYVASID